LTALPETEYIEIYNASNSDFHLKDWTFIYDGNSSPLPDTIIESGVYAVLFRAGRDIVAESGALLLGYDKFPSALANTGKTVAIKNSKGDVIDEVAYPQATPAKSYEKLPDATWHLSTDTRGGTPGSENSKAADPNPDPDPPTPPGGTTDYSKPGDIIINEIRATPVGLIAVPETEYIEIYNTSNSDFHLKDWTFVYDGNSSLLPDAIIQSGVYAVLFRAGREIVAESSALLLGYDKFPSALANTGKTIAIKNSKGDVIDEVAYPQATPAKSYEKLPDASWHLSTDTRGGTPGGENSFATTTPSIDDTFVIEPFEIVINEILANPYTGGSEYIELYNKSNKPLKIEGLAIALRNNEGNLRTHYPLKSVTDTIQPDGYMVLTESRDGVLNFYPQSPPESVVEVNLPILNNEGSDIVLFRIKDNVVIDEVIYSSGWHNGAIKDKKGVSLERIHPGGASDDRYNWASAVSEVGYGTPGYRNSQNRAETATDKISVSNPEYVHGFDYYEIKYKMDKQGYRCRMEVYSTSGIKVAEILNNQLIAFEGILKWDGKGQNGSKLSSGVYVFYAELYNSDGSRKIFKKAFLIR
jgi:hypothetical protein